MKGSTEYLALQLKETCLITGARWAVWLQRMEGYWMFSLEYRLSNTRKAALGKFIRQPKEASWLAGTFSSGRTRSRQAGLFDASLGCQRIFAFPNVQDHFVLLVGADQITKAAENFFRVLAIRSPAEELRRVRPEEVDEFPPGWQSAIFPFEYEMGASFNPGEVLENVLVYLVEFVPCEAALMSIRSGDTFRVEAIWNYPDTVRGATILASEEKMLADLVTSRKGAILDDLNVPEVDRLSRLLTEVSLTDIAVNKPVRSWMGVPIVIGQRVIGHVAFSSSQRGAFTPEHLHLVSLQATRLAYAVENAIVFGEAARYLQQLALLNDLASVASLGVDINEVSRRVIQRLQRTFRTDLVGVFLLSPDGKSLRAYGSEVEDSPALNLPVDSSLVGEVIERGLPVRFNDLRITPHFHQVDSNARSALAVPLKYRGRVIGALVLVSTDYNAFSSQDEQLFVLIASHLAGLFENMRLNEETRERAVKLADSVRQLQAVRETALDIAGDLDFDAMLRRVVQRACELVGAQGAELSLLDEVNQVVRVFVSEAPWANTQGEQVPLMAGVAGRVAAFGEPLVIEDYNSWSGRLNPKKKAPFKAVAGIPLKFQGHVIGILSVMDNRPDKVFWPEDVQLLELLAPQVAVWIRNARLYQELQERIEAQRLAENRLVRSARLAAVGEMAAGVAHELNNPLTTVIGFAELVLAELPTESPLRADLDLVLLESQRARQVVRGLLEFSRPVENHRMRVNINDLVNDVLNLVHHLLNTGGIEADIDLSEHLPWISLDPSQIKQVLLNLVHNAIQAMPGGGTLSVRTTQLDLEDREWLTIAVRDTGVGIPLEHMDRIFEPFFTNQPSGLGTGLGLSVSYGIVTEHEGFIDVQSQIGKGSSFTVYLPLETTRESEVVSSHA